MIFQPRLICRKEYQNRKKLRNDKTRTKEMIVIINRLPSDIMVREA